MDAPQDTKKVITIPYDKRLIGLLVAVCVLSAAVTGFSIYKLQDDSKFQAIEITESTYQEDIDSLTNQLSGLQVEVDRLETALNSQSDEDSDSEEDPTSTQEGKFLAPASLNFFENGNFLNGDTLLYEEPGSPALSVTLKFIKSSICIDGFKVCTFSTLPHGQDVFVAGKKSGDVVTVAVMMTR